MKILLFDNYDSFTYNLYQCVRKCTNASVDVYRNNTISLKKINEYDKIILSPGPGLPADSGILIPLIREYASSKSILGVCLGHQAIAETFGGRLELLKTVYHGVATSVKINGYTKKKNDVFKNLHSGLMAGRYHSWTVSRENFPDVLEVTALDEEGAIMGLQHKTYDIQGVQFHPESIMTPEGNQMIINFLNN